MPFDQIWNEVPLKVIDKEGEKRLTEKIRILFIEIQQNSKLSKKWPSNWEMKIFFQFWQFLVAV